MDRLQDELSESNRSLSPDSPQVSSQHSRVSPELFDASFDVESINGFKFQNDLLFYTKWENYPATSNTFEPWINLKSSVFLDYIENLHASLEADIELNNINMKRKLKKRILEALNKPKEMVLKNVSDFDLQEFKTYQAIYHLIKPNQLFMEKFENLFVINYIKQLQKKQDEEFRKLLLMIRKEDHITVAIVNEIDFSLPQKFVYITRNIHAASLIKTQAGCRSNPNRLLSAETPLKWEDVSEDMSLQQVPLTIFKSDYCGWGVKTMTKIVKGTVIVECVGEVLTLRQATEQLDKSYIFPARLEHSDRYYYIDAMMNGNLSRYVNHSCTPNSQIYSVHSSSNSLKDKKLVIAAVQDVDVGEEVTVDFNLHASLQKERVACYCKKRLCKLFF